MSFDWKEYIRVAKELINKGGEAYLRSGISRAYYGVFCIARNRTEYRSYTSSDVHKKVIDYYMRSQNSDEKRIGRTLDTIRRYRNDADYNSDKEIKYEDAQRVLIKAKEILDKLGIR
ncbi:MAG: hypothetical protein CBR30_07750 [Dictyoglomus sp. NZ13-RE01]|nr:MAG: hypothetical protein CBR30_07750 [Dictyoglomus sp. NZ13-RE01]